jgi:hypothetical protein
VHTSSVIDGLGEALARQPQAKILAQWRALATGELSFAEWARQLRTSEELSYLTIDTTGACDLTCAQMCYYHPDISLNEHEVPVEALERAISDASGQLQLKNLVFAGKEPLLKASRLFRLIAFAGSLPDKKFAIGLVTNGRHIERNFSDLRAAVEAHNLDFVDISLDSGQAEQHDAIRGQAGTFARAVTALQACRELPGLRVGFTSVLRHDNAEGLLTLLRETSPFNRNFFITPVQPPTFSPMRPLAWKKLRDFLQSLIRLLETELADAKLEVMVGLLGLHLFDAERDGFIRWEDFCEDAQGQCYVPRSFGSNRLFLHAQVLPETGWRIARITYTGAYLPNTHFLQDPNPARHAVGFVQQEPLPELYRRAMSQDSVLQQMIDSRVNHDCQNRPCWNACFGGLTAAEHSFVGGAPLQQQPHLCLKTPVDFIDSTQG